MDLTLRKEFDYLVPPEFLHTVEVGTRVKVPFNTRQVLGSVVWEPLVDHIQINSDNPRKSAEFYEKVLGLNLLRVGPPNDPTCCPPSTSASP